MSYPNTLDGRASALEAAGGDERRLWFDLDVIRVMPPEVPVVPFSVTRRQFLDGCDRLGLLPAVMAWRGAIDLSTLGGRSQARWFDESLAFERHNPVLIAAASALGLSDTQVDSAFVMMAGL